MIFDTWQFIDDMIDDFDGVPYSEMIGDSDE